MIIRLNITKYNILMKQYLISFSNCTLDIDLLRSTHSYFMIQFYETFIVYDSRIFYQHDYTLYTYIRGDSHYLAYIIKKDIFA